VTRLLATPHGDQRDVVGQVLGVHRAGDRVHHLVRVLGGVGEGLLQPLDIQAS
jgi:hypothetical protein